MSEQNDGDSLGLFCCDSHWYSISVMLFKPMQILAAESLVQKYRMIGPAQVNIHHTTIASTVPQELTTCRMTFGDCRCRPLGSKELENWRFVFPCDVACGERNNHLSGGVMIHCYESPRFVQDSPSKSCGRYLLPLKAISQQSEAS